MKDKVKSLLIDFKIRISLLWKYLLFLVKKWRTALKKYYPIVLTKAKEVGHKSLEVFREKVKIITSRLRSLPRNTKQILSAQITISFPIKKFVNRIVIRIFKEFRGAYRKLREQKVFANFARELRGVYRKLEEFKKSHSFLIHRYIESITRKMGSFHLPHIPRIIPAKKIVFAEKIILLILVFCYLLFNLLPYSSYRFTAFTDRPSSHFVIANQFFSNNDFLSARREYELALPHSSNYNEILGKIEETQKIIGEKAILEQEVSKWERILETKVNYRDAYLQLALLNYQLRRPITGRLYLAKAYDLDPNYQITKEAAEILQLPVSGF